MLGTLGRLQIRQVRLSQSSCDIHDLMLWCPFLEMVFDLEEEITLSDRAVDTTSVLPLIEQPSTVRPSRVRPRKPSTGGGLPASFSALRPMSLPDLGPSHIGSLASPPSPDTSRSVIPPTVGPTQLPPREEPQPLPPPAAETEEPWSFYEAEILKLVAANTPSHRGAWKKDGPAWQTFMRRQKNGDQDGAVAAGDGEDSLKLGLWEANHPKRADSDDSDDG